MPSFSYADADHWLGARSLLERVCPECSSSRKAEHRRLACFGLRRSAGDKIVYACMNCGIEGAVTAGWQERNLPAPGKPRSRFVPKHQAELEEKSTAHIAADIWRSAKAPAGTLVEAYWKARNLRLPIPPTVRFSDRGGRPMLVAALGLPILDGDEWFAPIDVRGIQRIFLNPYGSGHEGKKSLGDVKGRPLVCHVNPESSALVIGEGLEKVHRLAAVWNVDGWASCGVSFFRHLAPIVPSFVEVVTIIVDEGAERQVDELGELLVARGLEVKLTNAWEASHA